MSQDLRHDPGVRDPRVRDFVSPTRVVWTSPAGVHGASNLLDPDDRALCLLRREPGAEPASVLLDFGREMHGGLRVELPIRGVQGPVRARVRFGESVSEAMAEPNQDHTIHDMEVLLPWFGHQEVGHTGFRFARIDLLDEGVDAPISRVLAVAIYRDLPYLGSFTSSDSRLNEIWQVGAYTVHLCMQDMVWDGIKRDRLVWIGDMHPETMVVNTVFGNVDVVPQSLDYVREHTPLPQWMNGISSYSMVWLLCHRDWYRYHGNAAYLAEQREYLVGLVDGLIGLVGPDGCEHLPPHRFVEWPTARDTTAIDAGLQSLTVIALEAGAELCRVLGEADCAGRAAATAARARAHHRARTGSKQANSLLVLAGMTDATATNADILSRDPYRGLSTFYGYYVLQARAQAGDYQGCLDLIRNYWGGMIDVGATTFWEHFEIDWMEGAGRIDELPQPGLKDIHAETGDHCYVGLRHSYCHGWAAGPTAWLTEHVLGITPASPGFGTVRVAPNLGDLEWAEGTIPTPHGVIKVSHRKQADGTVKSTVELPAGVTRVD